MLASDKNLYFLSVITKNWCVGLYTIETSISFRSFWHSQKIWTDTFTVIYLKSNLPKSMAVDVNHFCFAST
jgi:hypothetical protein